MTVIDEIAAERRRQIEAEGYSTEHDDEHDNCQIARAAAAYAALSALYAYSSGQAADEYQTMIRGAAAMLWPWRTEKPKPTSARRDLVKAAALIVAEIERLDRAALNPS